MYQKYKKNLYNFQLIDLSFRLVSFVRILMFTLLFWDRLHRTFNKYWKFPASYNQTFVFTSFLKREFFSACLFTSIVLNSFQLTTQKSGQFLNGFFLFLKLNEVSPLKSGRNHQQCCEIEKWHTQTNFIHNRTQILHELLNLNARRSFFSRVFRIQWTWWRKYFIKSSTFPRSITRCCDFLFICVRLRSKIKRWPPQNIRVHLLYIFFWNWINKNV